MGCSGSKSNISLKSDITLEEKPNLFVCYLCKGNYHIQMSYLEQCKHHFHTKCLIELIEKQVEINNSYVIKCKCGTKTTTQQIRQSNLPNKLILLNQLFRQQLDILLKKLRKIPEYPDIEKQMNISKQHGDYYFYPEVEQLLYQETPQ